MAENGQGMTLNRSVVGSSLRRLTREAPTAWSLAAGMAGAALVLVGVLLMQQDPTRVALPSVPTGIFGDVFPSAEWVLLGSAVALVGCILVYRFLPAYLAAAPAVGPAGGHELAGRFANTRARRAIAAALAGVLLYAVALGGAATHSTFLGLPLCLAGSILLFCLAIGDLAGGVPAAKPTPWLRRELLYVAVVIGAFIALNLSDLKSWLYAYVGDEWAFYDAARALAGGATADPFSQMGVYGIQPALDTIYQALVMRLFGIDVVGWRLGSILAAALPALVLYWCARQIGGRLFAGVATFFYATCPLLWAFSHIGYNNNDTLLPMVAAAAFCLRGLRGGSPSHLFAAGASAGAGWYTIYTGRLMIGVLVLALIAEWSGGRRKMWHRLAVVLAGFALTIMPLLLDNGAATIRLMSHNSVFSTQPDASAVFRLVSQNTVRGAYAFLYSTATDHYCVGAIFDVVAAAALCIGLALALRPPFSAGTRLMLCWFLATSALTTPLGDSPGVSMTRSMVIVPPAALLAALGLCSVVLALRRGGGVQHSLLIYPALSGLLGLVLALNLHQFYVTVPDQQYPTFPRLVLMIKAIFSMPSTTFVLPADMPAQDGNGTFCSAMNGYRVDPATLIFPVRGRLSLYCPATGQAAAPKPEPAVYLFRDSQAAVAGCRLPPGQTLVAKQGTVWGYRLAIQAPRAGGYAAQVARLIGAICPQTMTGG